MAQIIDLGKLRFNFAGDWSSSTTYESNDVIRYGGNVYVYTNLVRTSGNLPTDTNYWSLMVEGTNFEGNWDSATAYQIGDTVAHGGIIYLATADTSNNIPPNISYWSVYTQGFQFEGTFNIGTTYQKNDIVTYGGQTYIAKTDTVGVLPTVSATWDKLAAGLSLEGAYSNTYAYVPGDIVNYGSNIYRNILESTGSVPPANTHWSLLISGSNYRSGWQGTTYYKIGDTVSLGGNLYKALADNHNAEPSLNGSLWQLQLPGLNNRGDWSAGQQYYPNEVFRHGGRTLLVNTSHSSNTYLINDINSGHVTSFSDGIRFRGEWTAGTNYLDNDVVIFTPNLYIANTDHTANTDFNVDRATNGYWEQLVAGASGIVPDITAAVDEGKYLKASGANTTVWAHPGAVEKFFFVSNSATANNDIYHGQTAEYAFANIKYACEYISADPSARTPATIYVKNGNYNEQLPITVPENVTIKGDSLRNTIIEPAAGNDDSGLVPNNKSTMFLLSSGTTIQDVLMRGMVGFEPGSSPDNITTATIGGVFMRLNPASTILKSPYINGCTAFSTKGVGAIVDGSVNAGVGSMLFHAFTQIHDGGVGFWVKDNGLAEIVSCFTYYAHLGYTTSGGGKIRALNGNNSYGNFGAVSGGFDTSENIVSGKLDGDSLSYVSATLSNTAGFGVGDTLTVGATTISVSANSMTVNTPNTVVTTDTAHGLINGQAFYFDQLNDSDWQDILGDHTNTHGRTWYARVYSNTQFGIASNYDASNLFNTVDLAGWGNVTLNVADATRSNPVIVTFSGNHGFTNGDKTTAFSSVGGMTQLNGNEYFVQSTGATTVQLYSDSGLSSSVDGTGFGAYTSGGTTQRQIVGTSMTGGTIRIPTPTTTIRNIQTNLTDGTHRLVVANTTYGKTGQSFKVNVGKNNANTDVYYINGEKTKQLKFYNNRTYIFEQNDITNVNKPLILSSTSGSLTEVPNAFYYLDDVSVNATTYATNFNSSTRRYHGITIAAGAAANTYYYLSANSLNVVGNTVSTANASSNVHESFQRQYIPWKPFWVANTTITAQDGTSARLTGGDAGHRGQYGFALALKELSEQPRPGGSIQFKTSVTYSPNTHQVISGTTQETGEEARSFIISTVTGFSEADGTAIITLTQEKQPTAAGYNGQDVHVRYNYSQIRLTGHDFLSIGTGNTVTSNYPGEPTQAAAQGNEVVENLPGRVYYVSTDQDGNFRVGDYFRIDQATGRATLDASAFDLSGLTSLRLGSIGAQIGESINEFSSDASLSDASNIAVPTEQAVKTYVDTEISNLQVSVQNQINSLENSTGFILLSNDYTNTSVQYNSNNQIIAANTNGIGYSNVIYNTVGYITSFTERNFATNVYQNVLMTYNANNNVTSVNATIITP